VRVTVSLGVAQFEPGDDAERLFRRADQRLYRAKEQGRNRVVAAA
jgi:diguanylate cyclase (GGDEF)-like protein